MVSVPQKRKPKMFDTALRIDADGPGGIATVNNLRFLATSAAYTMERMRPFHDQPVVPVTGRNGSIVVLLGETPVREFFNDNDTFHRAGEEVFQLPHGRPWSGMFQASISFNGDEHRRRRRLLMPVVQKSALDHYRETFTETYAASRFAADAGAVTGAGKPFDAVAELLRISQANMLRCLLGLPVTPENIQLAEEIVSLTQRLFSPGVVLLRWDRPFTPYGRWLGDVAAAYEALAKLIEQRRGEDQRPDALSILCNTTDEDGDFLSTDEIAGELHAFFSAGFETTAMTMTWALVAALGSGRVEELTSADGVDATVKESQRVLPAVPIALPRHTTREVSVGGSAVIPAGAMVVTSAMVEQHRPQAYPEPFRYRPERWRDGTVPKPWEFFPFGLGARRCLGAAFADLQARETLGLIGAEPRLPHLLTRAIDYRMKSGVVAAPTKPVMITYGEAPAVAWPITGGITRYWHPDTSDQGS